MGLVGSAIAAVALLVTTPFPPVGGYTRCVELTCTEKPPVNVLHERRAFLGENIGSPKIVSENIFPKECGLHDHVCFSALNPFDHFFSDLLSGDMKSASAGTSGGNRAEVTREVMHFDSHVRGNKDQNRGDAVSNKGRLAGVLKGKLEPDNVVVDMKVATVTGKVGPNLRLSDALSLVSGSVGGGNGVSGGFERSLEQDDSNDAYDRRSERQDRHGPLGIRIARRELGPPIPFGWAAIIGLSVLGLLGSSLYLLIGWSIGLWRDERENDNRQQRHP